MPRELVVGNGRILVNFDSRLVMRDFYYPHVGQWNHIGGNRNSFGIWVNGHFVWCDENGWDRKLSYKADALVTEVEATHHALGLHLEINDAVHYRDNIYIKKMVVANNFDHDREVRIFFTHDFTIDETEVGDTAVFDPEMRAVYHYKKGKYFLVNGYSEEEGIFQYATGTKRFHGAEGTWRDAEDGNLEGNPISQGSVDSTVSFRLLIPAKGNKTLYYWITAGRNYQEVRDLNQYVHVKTPEGIFHRIETYWHKWVNKEDMNWANLPQEVICLYKRSLLVTRTQVDKKGAIMAANDSDILQYNRDHYSYMWPRDGALTSYAMIKAGFPEMTENFFHFCCNALTKGGYLLHKYNADGSAGSSWHPWVRDGQFQLPIQEDETALVLFALWEYFKKTRDIEFVLQFYRPMIKPAADFMVDFQVKKLNLPAESYDLWEERRGIYTFTAAAVYGGLKAASNISQILGDEEKRLKYCQAAEKIKKGILEHLYDKALGRFMRGINVDGEGNIKKDITIESSTFGITAFGVLPPDDKKVISTMQAVEKDLWVKTPVGGIARYTNDHYFQKSSDIENVPGNPWFITTLWLAEWYIGRARNTADLARPLEILQWVAKHAMPSGVLPEQIHPYSGEPLSVAPLTWSHSGFVLAVAKYLEKYKEFECRDVCSI